MSKKETIEIEWFTLEEKDPDITYTFVWVKMKDGSISYVNPRWINEYNSRDILYWTTPVSLIPKQVSFLFVNSLVASMKLIKAIYIKLESLSFIELTYINTVFILLELFYLICKL